MRVLNEVLLFKSGFLPVEVEFLLKLGESCKKCGHLDVFHNSHCCAFCQIPGCSCRS